MNNNNLNSQSFYGLNRQLTPEEAAYLNEVGMLDQFFTWRAFFYGIFNISIIGTAINLSLIYIFFFMRSSIGIYPPSCIFAAFIDIILVYMFCQKT